MPAPTAPPARPGARLAWRRSTRVDTVEQAVPAEKDSTMSSASETGIECGEATGRVAAPIGTAAGRTPAVNSA